MKAVIIDDEGKAIENLKAVLMLFNCKIEIIGEATNVADAVRLINKSKPELVFLDIEMPDGDGFQLLEKVDFNDFQTIFITAHSEYAIRALRINALDYITKPIDPEDLLNAIESANSKERSSNNHQNIHTLIEGNKKGRFDKIGVPFKGGIKYFQIEELIRLEASSNYTRIRVKSKDREILVAKTLKHYDVLLEEYGFIRVHQSHLVNPKYIVEFHRGDGSFLLLDNGDRIPVSKSKRSSVNQLLKN